MKQVEQEVRDALNFFIDSLPLWPDNSPYWDEAPDPDDTGFEDACRTLREIGLQSLPTLLSFIEEKKKERQERGQEEVPKQHIEYLQDIGVEVLGWFEKFLEICSFPDHHEEIKQIKTALTSDDDVDAEKTSAAMERLISLEREATPALIRGLKQSANFRHFNFYPIRDILASRINRGDTECLEKVRDLLEDDDNNIKIKALLILGNCGDHESIPKVLPFLKSHSRDLKEYSIWFLGRVGDPSVARNILPFLWKDVFWVEEACVALNRLKPYEDPDVIQAFVSVMENLANNNKKREETEKVSWKIEYLIKAIGKIWRNTGNIKIVKVLFTKTLRGWLPDWEWHSLREKIREAIASCLPKKDRLALYRVEARYGYYHLEWGENLTVWEKWVEKWIEEHT